MRFGEDRRFLLPGRKRSARESEAEFFMISALICENWGIYGYGNAGVVPRLGSLVVGISLKIWARRGKLAVG